MVLVETSGFPYSETGTGGFLTDTYTLARTHSHVPSTLYLHALTPCPAGIRTHTQRRYMFRGPLGPAGVGRGESHKVEGDVGYSGNI